MILLSDVFITCIPNMLNAGNKNGTIKNAFSDLLKLKFGIANENASLFVLYPTIQSKIMATLNEIKRGIVDSGVA